MASENKSKVSILTNGIIKENPRSEEHTSEPSHRT